MVRKPIIAAVLALAMTIHAFAQDAPSGPLGIMGADPSIIETEDGFVSVESRAGRTLFVRVAPSLDGLGAAKPVRVWTDRDGIGEVWAPEIVQRNGQYEIHFAGGVGAAHRMYVIRSDEPAADYGAAEQLLLPDDKWAIDGLAFSYDGGDYYVWSGWAGDTDVQQDIYLAPIDEDGSFTDARVMISAPDQAWENIAGETPAINEGPQPVLDPGGALHIVYSANGSWGPNYCLSDLRLAVGGDPLDPQDWSKPDGCLFGANPETLAESGTLANEAKGVGHHSFVLPDGALEAPVEADTSYPFIYHGVPAEDNPRNFWAARKWFGGSFKWVPNVAYGSGDTGWSIRFSED